MWKSLYQRPMCEVSIYSAQTWTLAQWKKFSDESSFAMFLIYRWIYDGTNPADAFHPQCLLPIVKYSGESVMVWAVISYCGNQWQTVLHGCITAINIANKYEVILQDCVPPTVQTLFSVDVHIFLKDSSLIHSTIYTVYIWSTNFLSF